MKSFLLVCSFQVQAVFCAISGSHDISKTKLGMKLEELEILRYLGKYWSCRTKTIPEQRQHKQITYFQKHQLTKYHFQTTDKVNNVKNIFLGPKISILCWASFASTEVSISHSWNLIPHFVFFISRLPDIAQNTACTRNEAMDITFQMKFISAAQFFETPCTHLPNT